MKRIWKSQYKFDDAKINCLRDSSTRRDLHVFALLRFDIVKNSICIVSFLLVLKRSLYMSLIHLAFIQHSLKQIWSIPIHYVLTGAADMS